MRVANDLPIAPRIEKHWRQNPGSNLIDEGVSNHTLHAIELRKPKKFSLHGLKTPPSVELRARHKRWSRRVAYVQLLDSCKATELFLGTVVVPVVIAKFSLVRMTKRIRGSNARYNTHRKRHRIRPWLTGQRIIARELTRTGVFDLGYPTNAVVDARQKICCTGATEEGSQIDRLDSWVVIRACHNVVCRPVAIQISPADSCVQCSRWQTCDDMPRGEAVVSEVDPVPKRTWLCSLHDQVCETVPGYVLKLRVPDILRVQDRVRNADAGHCSEMPVTKTSCDRNRGRSDLADVGYPVTVEIRNLNAVCRQRESLRTANSNWLSISLLSKVKPNPIARGAFDALDNINPLVEVQIGRLHVLGPEWGRGDHI